MREMNQRYQILEVGLSDGFGVGVQERLVLMIRFSQELGRVPVTDMGILLEGQV